MCSSVGTHTEPVWPHGSRIASAVQLTPSEVKSLLIYENELRLCDETMHEFEKVRDEGGSDGGAGHDGWLGIVEGIQKRVCKHFGVSEFVGVTAMRCAETLPQMTHTDVEQVRAISHYRKFNRCIDGSLKVHDAAPSTTLWQLLDRRSDALKHVLFPSFTTSSLPLLVVAASYS